MTVEFWVPGVPAPQGSKRAVRRGAKVVLIEMSKKVRPWRSAIAVVASRFDPFPPRQPVALHVEFYLPRPKTHYGTGRNAETVKARAPVFVVGVPDVDKLLRASCDGLTDSGLIPDDSLIVAVSGVKRYAARGASGARFTLRPVPLSAPA